MRRFIACRLVKLAHGPLFALVIVALLAPVGLVLSVAQSYAADISPAIIATVPVGNTPDGVAVNPTTNRIYVANAVPISVPNIVSVIDGATNMVIASVGVGNYSVAGAHVHPLGACYAVAPRAKTGSTTQEQVEQEREHQRQNNCQPTHEAGPPTSICAQLRR